MNIHENLIKRASRFLVEAPEDEINLDQPIEEPIEEPTIEPEPVADDNSETGADDKSSKIEIYYSNLDVETQKSIMSSLVKELNATEDDEIAQQKIVEQLSKQPLFVVMGDELQRKLQIKI